MVFITTAGEVSLVVPSFAVHVWASDDAFVLLIAVSGDTPVWLGLARNIGQSENTEGSARRPWPWLWPRCAGRRGGTAAALAGPATASAPARAAPAAATAASAVLDGISFDTNMLLASAAVD